MNFLGKKVTIVGAAKSGMDAAKLALELQAQVKISEQNALEAIPKDFQAWLKDKDIPLECGGHTASFIQESDFLIVSPGVKINASPIQWAQGKKIPVMSEIEFAARLCPKPIIAVTGSNGKTTVSTLIANVINADGKKACLCGNIGSPFSQYVSQIDGYDFVVLEVSSFQLETTILFKPYIAVLLNFCQNHLDRHKDMEEYWEAKKRIFMNQDEHDFAVINGDDKKISHLAEQLRAKTVCFHLQERVDGFEDISVNPNIAAALVVAKILKIPDNVCKNVFKNFQGIEHRLEKVRTINKVDFINDSKATTVEAGRWAITNISQPLIMICGGRDKNIDFSVLRNLIKGKVKKMIVIGEAKDKIKGIFEDLIPVQECGDLKSAVTEAQKVAVPGDCVLLSPMCASFDMFKNFEERGSVFKKIVSEL